MEYLGLGIQLAIVGMCTVFLILLIVIIGGKLLINFVNRFAPEDEAPVKKPLAVQNGAVDASTMAILQEVVKQLTGGKGHIQSAKKI